MAISKELMIKMANKLRTERLNSEFYAGFEGLMQDALTQIGRAYNLSLNQLNFFVAGDHMLNTNIGSSSPLVIFVSIKQKREDILALRKSQKVSKRMQKFITPTLELTDQFLAEQLFNVLQAQLEPTDKLFIDKNILIINIAKLIKVKIIVGYYFNDIFEYEYLGNYYEENTLKIIETFDEKEKETGYFYDLVRILKSIEIEMFDLGYIKYKSYDTLYFVENLVYNIPNELLKADDIYEVFLKAINYLKNARLNEFKLPSNNKNMFDNYSQYSQHKAKYFIKVIEHFFKNFEQIIVS